MVSFAELFNTWNSYQQFSNYPIQTTLILKLKPTTNGTWSAKNKYLKQRSEFHFLHSFSRLHENRYTETVSIEQVL